MPRNRTMVIEEHVLHRSGDRKLKLKGELVGSARGEDFKAEKDPRWYNLYLYKTDRGKFVLHIAYRHNGKADGEMEWDGVEKFDDPDAVVDYLKKFDPIAHSLGWPPDKKWEEHRAYDQKKLKAIYLSMVSQLLQSDEFDETLE